MRESISATLHFIQDTKSLSSTEDALFAWSDGTRFTLMVADGAPPRLEATHSLLPLLNNSWGIVTPGRYASFLARDATARLTIDARLTPRDLALAANAELRDNLQRIYGTLTANDILEHEPTLAQLHEDPRFLRWMLPVCCYTVAQVDLATGTIHYAHAGDTAIFACYKDGHTEQVTPDQMAQHDNKVRRRILEIMQSETIRTREDLLPYMESIQALNQYNGIYHNYEDERGEPDTQVGVGVINGLTQLEHYLIEGSLAIADLTALILTTDGAFWPASLDETDQQAAERINEMGRHIVKNGLPSYIADLREEEISDSDGRKYQLFGNHDDATVIMLNFGA